MSQTRRDFLRKSGCALGMAALATSFDHFGRMSAFAQQDGGATDYRALVCIFLSGGNDGNNTVVPNHDSATISNYTSYSNVRAASGLAIPRPSLLPITPPRMGGLAYGLHPNMTDLHTLWGQQKLAVLCNVGNLVEPITRTQYQNNSKLKPYQLFSHSDQVTQQQTSYAKSRYQTGWGGRTADYTLGLNSGQLIPMITSIAGAQIFTTGEASSPLAIASGNVPLNQVLVLNGFNTTAESIARRNAYNQLRGVDLDSNVISAASDVTQQAVDASAALNINPTTGTFPNTNLGNQLRQVARLLQMRTQLSINRQIFFCSLGGFDTHANQPNDQALLFTQVSQAMKAFYDETVALNIQNSVTTFTLSDFGRTLSPSGTGAAVGTDHAWANHAFIMGGAVRGGDFYGMNTSNGTPFPTLALDGPDDVSNRGRWIPTTSVDQYAATLAAWYGLDPQFNDEVFPLLGNFSTTNLGFML